MTTYWLVWVGAPYRGPRRRELDSGRLLRPDPWEPGCDALRPLGKKSSLRKLAAIDTQERPAIGKPAIMQWTRTRGMINAPNSRFKTLPPSRRQLYLIRGRRLCRSSRLCKENSKGWRNWYHLGQERSVWVASHQDRSSQHQPRRDTHV
jgi:hypothetical protein